MTKLKLIGFVAALVCWAASAALARHAAVHRAP